MAELRTNPLIFQRGDTRGILCKCVKCLHNKDVGSWNKENKTIFHHRVESTAAHAAVRGAEFGAFKWLILTTSNYKW